MKNIILLFLFAIILSTSCSSRSSDRYKNRLDDIYIFKSDITQDDLSVYFTTYDTVGYVVTITDYTTRIVNVSEYDNELVFISVAYTTENGITTYNLKINDNN